MQTRLLNCYYLIFFVLLINNRSYGDEVQKSQLKNVSSMDDYDIPSYSINYSYDDYDDNIDDLFESGITKIKLKDVPNPDKNARPFDKNPWFEFLWHGIHSNKPNRPAKNSSQSVSMDNEMHSIDKLIQNYIIHKTLLDMNTTKKESSWKNDTILDDFPKEVPKCAEQYCTDVSNYPTRALLDALKKTKDLFLHNDQIVNSDITLRMGIADIENDVPLCESEESLIYPKTAQNIYNEWFFIVNEGTYTQSIKVEICKKENSPCNIIEGFRLGYDTYCKQRYIVRELITFNKTGQFGKSSFRFPASCCCSAKMNFLQSYRLASHAEGFKKNNDSMVIREQPRDT